MEAIQILAFALLTGVTVCGLSGTILELVSGSTLSFAEPFNAPRRPVRLVTATLLAGPLMFFNDSLAALRGGTISPFFFVSCAVTAAGWALALGVTAIDLATKLFAQLG